MTRLPEPAWIAQAENFLLGGDFEGCLAVCESAEVVEKSHKRIMLHLKARSQIQLGDLEGAKSNLLLAERHFGQHIGVLADLACLYYQSGEIHQWRQSVGQLQQRFDEVGAQLSALTWVQTLVLLGKFREEEGSIADAIANFEQAYLRAKKDLPSNLQHLALIQRLRLEALFARGPELGHWYRELLILPQDELSFDLYVEREHTLILAELELIGPQQAWARAQLILAKAKLSQADRCLIIADLFAESTLRGFAIPLALRELGQELATHGDAYEREIHALVASPEDLGTRLAALASEMSWAGYLRLLTCWHQQLTDEGQKVELSKKLQFLLTTLAPQSRYLWLKRLQASVLSDELSLQFREGQHCLRYQDKIVDLSRKRTLSSILALIGVRRQISVDELIKGLWQTEFTPHHLHRLRMAVHRLNLLLFELCAVPKVIELSLDQVSVRPTVTIKLIK